MSQEEDKGEQASENPTPIEWPLLMILIAVVVIALVALLGPFLSQVWPGLALPFGK